MSTSQEALTPAQITLSMLRNSQCVSIKYNKKDQNLIYRFRDNNGCDIEISENHQSFAKEYMVQALNLPKFKRYRSHSIFIQDLITVNSNRRSTNSSRNQTTTTADNVNTSSSSISNDNFLTRQSDTAIDSSTRTTSEYRSQKTYDELIRESREIAYEDLRAMDQKSKDFNILSISFKDNGIYVKYKTSSDQIFDKPLSVLSYRQHVILNRYMCSKLSILK